MKQILSTPLDKKRDLTGSIIKGARNYAAQTLNYAKAFSAKLRSSVIPSPSSPRHPGEEPATTPGSANDSSVIPANAGIQALDPRVKPEDDTSGTVGMTGLRKLAAKLRSSVIPRRVLSVIPVSTRGGSALGGKTGIQRLRKAWIPAFARMTRGKNLDPGSWAGMTIRRHPGLSRIRRFWSRILPRMTKGIAMTLGRVMKPIFPAIGRDPANGGGNSPLLSVYPVRCGRYLTGVIPAILSVIPVQTGIQALLSVMPGHDLASRAWIPAFARMTERLGMTAVTNLTLRSPLTLRAKLQAPREALIRGSRLLARTVRALVGGVASWRPSPRQPRGVLWVNI